MCASLWIISYWYFFLTRFYHGICTGMLFIAVPLYLGEISPKSLRGGIIMMVLVFYIIGVLLGQILSLQEVFGTQKGVPVLLNLTWVMPVFQILLLPFFPESPRYLFIQKKDEVRARQALKKLRDRSDVEDEIEELHQEDLVEKAEKNMTPLKLLLKTPKLRWQVITIIVLMGGQQVDGISVAYLYKEKIFMSMMLGENEIHFALIGTTVFYCFSSILGVYFADSKGHRILLVTGFGICCIISVLLNMTLGIETAIPEIVYFTLIFINIFMFGHAIGPGSLPSVLVAELFLQSSRSSAFVIAGVMKWLTNFLVGVIVLYVERNLGAYSFTIFCPVLIAIFIYVFKFIPETKNKTFLDIRRLMGIHNGKKIDIKEQTDK
ncbi:solute carrier family 2, facilitated glucose transporter member 5-like [Rhineura floridana]|uniref:solute carrier family 2, facilitated glucose transporter member 5-like n=1 Tax=Rhineura floridana TaxID=261503 RepID=UPI002AC7F20A|nr:solute carrier family 2, facilitated glucose transporter member 5-like [Rhineura floridana]